MRDLSGQTFGRLTVGQLAGQGRRGRAFWLCRCSCGAETRVSSSNLVQGHTQSCGCLQREATSTAAKTRKRPRTFEDISLRHQPAPARLMAVFPVGCRLRTIYWACLCDCGNTIVTSASNFKTKNTSSCGCRRTEMQSLHLEGQVFGRLTVVRCVGKRKRSNNFFWLCQCSCGNTTEVRGSSLMDGTTSSCGCRAQEKSWQVKHGHARHAFGCRTSPTYTAWENMKHRCLNPNAHEFQNYGGAGVKVCKRWLGEYGFENFLADLGERPASHYSLSRHLDTGSYEPGNVQWGTRAEQFAEARGKRAMRALHAWHESQSVCEMAVAA